MASDGEAGNFSGNEVALPDAQEQFPYDERGNNARIDQKEWHFHRRLWTRYGIVLRPGEYSTMRTKLRKGKAKLLKQKPSGAGLYLIYMRREGIPIFVVAYGERMMTVLPPSRQLNRMLSKRQSSSVLGSP